MQSIIELKFIALCSFFRHCALEGLQISLKDKGAWLVHSCLGLPLCSLAVLSPWLQGFHGSFSASHTKLAGLKTSGDFILCLQSLRRSSGITGAVVWFLCQFWEFEPRACDSPLHTHLNSVDLCLLIFHLLVSPTLLGSSALTTHDPLVPLTCGTGGFYFIALITFSLK